MPDLRIIAEGGTCNHDIAWAHEAVDAAADAACWGFKVQLLRPSTLLSPAATGYGRPELKESAPADAFADPLPYDAWTEVRDHCNDVGLEFFASAWDFEAVDALDALGCKWIKVGSAEITHLRLLDYIATTDMNVMLSTGAAETREVEQAIERLDGVKRLVLMGCTLSYPCDLEHAALHRITEMRTLITLMQTSTRDTVGYSDHTRGTGIAALAVAAGARYLEKHFTVTPGIGGDHNFALDPAQMDDYVCEALRADRILHPAEDAYLFRRTLLVEADALARARRGLWATVDLPEGTPILDAIEAGDLAWLRPVGDTIPADYRLTDNHVLKAPVSAGDPVTSDLLG